VISIPVALAESLALSTAIRGHMGQAKRRNAEIDRLKRTHPKGLSAIAIHEAGHAVARFMTAKRMGYDCQADALTATQD
jgi:hypothetical protein